MHESARLTSRQTSSFSAMSEQKRPVEVPLEKFVTSQLELLQLEHDSEVEEAAQYRSNYSEAELRDRGVCLQHLVLSKLHTGLYGRSLCTLARFDAGPLPSSSFSTRDIVQLRCPNPATEASGIIYRINQFKVTIAFDTHTDDLSMLFNKRVSLVRLANDVTYKRNKAVLEQLGRVDQGSGAFNKHLIDVLLARTEPRFDKREVKWTPVNLGLNHTQVDAISHALAAEDLMVIHGPPGTGKTTTVVELIYQCVARGETVLACAPSNIAVDNITEKLSAYRSQVKKDMDLRICRVGHPARLLPSVLSASLEAQISESDDAALARDIRKELDTALTKIRKSKDKSEKYEIRRELSELRKELREREKRASESVLKHAQVILCTNSGAASYQLKDRHFDTVIIDECAQSVEMSCWIPVLKGKRVILAGDHKQLPPTIKSAAAEAKGLSTTLFDRMVAAWGDSVVRMLTVQYRMHECIMRWSSEEMYESRLTAFEGVAKHLLKDIDSVATTADTITPMVFIDTAGCYLAESETRQGESKSNEGEAKVVAEHVRALISAGLPADDIGVITPYNAQVNLLRELLLFDHPALEIGTVDGFQGREKEAIVISMVRSNDERVVGFLQENRRTNVAVTRARRHVAVVVDSATVASDAFLSRLIEYGTQHADYRSALPSAVDTVANTAPPSTVAEPSSANAPPTPSSNEPLEPSPVMLGLLRSKPVAESSRPRMSAAQRKADKRSSEPRATQNPRSDTSLHRPAAAESKAHAGPFNPNNIDVHANLLAQPDHEYTPEQVCSLLLALLKQWKNGKRSQGKAFHFPSTLNSYWRRQVHAACDTLNAQDHGLKLLHASEGTGKGRYIVISPQPCAAEGVSDRSETDAPPAADKHTAREAPPQPKVLLRDIPHGSEHPQIQCSGLGNAFDVLASLDSQAALQGKKIHVPPGYAMCDLCRRHIPEQNMKLHSLRCTGEEAEEDFAAPPSQKKNKNKRKKKKKKEPEEASTEAPGEDQDLDAILKDLDINPNKCSATGCKAKLRLTGGFVCEHCKLNYCITHMNPIFHGCADESRKAKRAAMAEGLRRQQGKPRPLKEGERKQLSSMLREKVNDKTKERTAESAKPNKRPSRKGGRAAALAAMKKKK